MVGDLLIRHDIIVLLRMQVVTLLNQSTVVCRYMVRSLSASIALRRCESVLACHWNGLSLILRASFRSSSEKSTQAQVSSGVSKVYREQLAQEPSFMSEGE